MRIALEREFRLVMVVMVCGSAAGCAGGRDDEAGDAIAARLSPVRVDSIDAPGDGATESSPWKLFDRDTHVGWSPSGETADGPARVRVALAAPTAITHLKVFGPSPYVL